MPSVQIWTAALCLFSRRHTILHQKLLPIDELFLFLTYLSTGSTPRELSHRFNIHRTTVGRIIVTWANFLHSLLGSICFWMSPAAVKTCLLPEFDGRYSNTQVIVDCTELRCQTPSSLLLQREVFSTYKSHCTFKATVGMSPNGALTFVSTLNERQGSVSPVRNYISFNHRDGHYG